MNSELRMALIAKIKEIGLPEAIQQTPTVSIEDFFKGNDDLGSIGCNLLEHPGVERFYDVFKRIRAKEEVADVLVGIHEIEESDDTMWPFSEQVFIITSEPESVIRSWVQDLEVDSIDESDKSSLLPEPDIPEGCRLLQLWWD